MKEDSVMNNLPNQAPIQGAVEFANAIEIARNIMLSAPWYSFSNAAEQERAFAEKQLKHQISAALDQGFVLHDPYQPEFRSLNQHNQFGLFNPDNRYHIATISSDGIYLIRGWRGTSASLEIQVGAGRPGFDENLTSPITVSQMSQDKLEVDEEGYFEIVISEHRTGKNWLNINKDGLQGNSILIRESFMDWEKEKSGTWYIERTDTRGLPSPIPTLDLVNKQYARASEYLINATKGWVKFVDGLRANLAGNRLSPPKETVNGLPGQWNSAGWFALNPNIAIVIKVPTSPAIYQSIQIGDLWFNALDYCRRQTSLTTAQAVKSEDGKYRFVISVNDPGIANWLDPSGNANLFVFLRWQGLPDCYEFCEQPSVEMVPMNELNEYLKGEPRFRKRQREHQLAARKASSLSSPRGF